MSRDRRIDPVTRDYVRDGAGGFEKTSTSATKIFHQLSGRRGHWWANANSGSDLYLVRKRNAGADGRVFAENAVRSALQPFVDRGLIRDVNVEVSSDERGRLCLVGTMTDTRGEVIDVTGLSPFGVT